MRPKSDYDAVLERVLAGMNDSAIARAVGVPRRTVHDWRVGRFAHARRAEECNHDFQEFNSDAYAYLLGLYLGDGCLSEHPRSVFRLRITLDDSYPGIIAECAKAMTAVTPGRVHLGAHSKGKATVVSSYWKHWPCVFPQHGPGPKHARPIRLAPWQKEVVARHPQSLLRGLIHSDGTRIVATERKGRYVRRAPRYGFSNRSEDILELFRSTCASLGIHTTQASVKQVAVYRKDAVARLDEFIGPKT